jgi:hypothetical protein
VLGNEMMRDEWKEGRKEEGREVGMDERKQVG